MRPPQLLLALLVTAALLPACQRADPNTEAPDAEGDRALAEEGVEGTVPGETPAPLTPGDSLPPTGLPEGLDGAPIDLVPADSLLAPP